MLALAFSACKKQEEVYKVEFKALNEAVYASGKVMPGEYSVIGSLFPEQILRISVREGDVVSSGEPLVILGTPAQQKQLALLRQQLSIAREQASGNSAVLQQLKASIALAEQQYEQDRLNADRLAALARDTAVSQQAAAAAALKARNSLTEWQNQQQQLGVRKSELSSRLIQARGDLENYRQQRFQRVLTSTTDGKVFNINFKEGESVQAGESILLVGTPDAYKLELLVDERDIVKIDSGQQVLFETDAYAGKQFRARLTHIDPVLKKESRSFEVEAEVLSEGTFYPQASVEANIMVRENVKALLIPLDYLLPGDSVWLKTGEAAEKAGVITGIRSENWIEVKEGLKEGALIVKKAP